MSYILTEDYFINNLTTTSVEFRKNDSITSPIKYIDSDFRVTVIEYPTGCKYSDLPDYPNWSYKSDREIDNHYILVKFRYDCIINGVKYYVNNQINFLECRIYNAKVNPVPYSYCYVDGTTIQIILSSKDTDKWDVADYKAFLENTGYFKIDIVDETKFKFTNFNAIDLRYRFVRDINDHTEYQYQSIAINDSDILSTFITHLQKNHSKYTFSAELSDLTNQDFKDGYIYYNSELSIPGEDLCARLFTDPKYGKMMLTARKVSFEYITDDIQKYLFFRDSQVFANEFYLDHYFELIDAEGLTWRYTVVWDYEFTSTIDRSPSTKYFDDTLLYTKSFSAIVVGYIVEKITRPTYISYPIVRMYDQYWNLVASIFDNSDPNIMQRITIDVGIGVLMLDAPSGFPVNPVLTEDGSCIRLEGLSTIKKIVYHDPTDNKNYEVYPDSEYNRIRIIKDQDGFNVETDEILNPVNLGHGKINFFREGLVKDLVKISNVVPTEHGFRIYY